ncbi:MAG: hypothetical protein R8K22_02490 [Mariprofundaceae bacterium]
MSITLGVMFQMDRTPTAVVSTPKQQVLDVQPMPTVQDEIPLQEAVRRSPLLASESQKSAQLSPGYSFRGKSEVPIQTGTRLDLFG